MQRFSSVAKLLTVHNRKPFIFISSVTTLWPFDVSNRYTQTKYNKKKTLEILLSFDLAQRYEQETKMKILKKLQ